MKIAIIGAGTVGSALAEASTGAGHSVVLSASDPSNADRVAGQTGAQAASSNAEAVAEADLVILAVQADVIHSIVRDLARALRGRAVIDLANRPTPDPIGDRCTSIAEELQAIAPEARIVKAMNTIFVARQRKPEIAGMRPDGFVAGDEAEAKQRAVDYVRSIGFRPIDVGGLRMARVLEGMAWIHITLQMEHGWPWESAWKIVGPTGD